MLNEDVLRTALRRAGLPDAPVRYEQVVDSTNALALRLAAAGAPEWTTVAAGHQTAGRGRLGRRWESPSTGGLTFSFVLRPELSGEETSLLTLLAGAAAARACRDTGGAEVTCKWPNDLLVDPLKIGGILSEARVGTYRIVHVVVGVGINSGTVPPGVEGAGALEIADPGELLASFLLRFADGYRRPPDGFARAVLGLYRPLCGTLGRRVRARTTGGSTVEGVAEDLDHSGNLLVRTKGTLRTVAFGEVEHLRTGTKGST